MPVTPRDTRPIEFQVTLEAPRQRGQAAPGKTKAGKARQAVPGQDLVAITVGSPAAGAGAQPQADLVLYLAPENARELLHAQQGGLPAAAHRGASKDVAKAVMPERAVWALPGGASHAPAQQHRGMASDVVFKALEVVAGSAGLVSAGAQALGAVLDKRIHAGVYRLSSQQLTPLKKPQALVSMPAAPAGAPVLVLLHGTFVDTLSTFGAWWQNHPDMVRQVFKAYGDRVYALDHPTLTVSPISNALMLAKACAPGACLHLLTHSRGGLVAEVLARVCSECSENTAQGISAADDPLLAGDAYAAHRRDLRELAKVVKAKQLQVQRIVRVACPAHGTTLASGRLDACLSVFIWLLRLSGLPVLPQMLDLVKAIAHERTKPEAFPGLEAMLPGSALVQWLNAPDAQVDGQLRVIAGDIEGDSLGSWAKMLLSNAFYGGDNDLVVDTRSMYGGAVRKGGALFMLQRSARIDHGSYFAQHASAQAALLALTQDAPAGFAPIGPLSRQGQSASGERGWFGADDTRIHDAMTRAEAAHGSRPAVIVIPGILGSNLKGPNGREWFSVKRIRGVMDRIAWHANDNQIEADGPIDNFYADLVQHLEATHDVLHFAFDWRSPIELEARRMSKLVQRELDRRQASGQCVRIVAHSMGGVLTRVMQLEAAPVWQAMMSRPGVRVVMLGTPNAGSWAPMSIFTGDDKMGRILSSVAGFPFSEKRMRDQAARLPGLLQLQQGVLDPQLGLDQQSTWEDWARRDLAASRSALSWHWSEDNSAVYEWAIPPQAVLDQARALNERLSAQGPVLQACADKITVVLGQADSTPCGVSWGADGSMDYVLTEQGDGRVPWASTLLSGVKAWLVPATHGDLPKAQQAFGLYTDLLLKGQGDARWAFMDSARGAPGSQAAAPDKHKASTPRTARPTRAWAAALPATQRSADDACLADDLEALLSELTRGFASAPTALASRPGAKPSGAARRASEPALHARVRIQVINGDVRFAQGPLLLGHTRSVQMTGAEWVVNPLIGGLLQASLDMDMYPEDPGQVQVFVNRHLNPNQPFALPRPEAVVVVGLGDEGDVTLALLRQAVREGVLAYARHLWVQHRNEAPQSSTALAHFGMSAMLMGSGSGATVRDAALALAHGAADANRDIASQPEAQRWPQLTELSITELYMNRATEAVYALLDAATQLSGRIEVETTINAQPSGQRRPPGVGYRGAGYDLIRIIASPQQDQLEYTLFTNRARSEIRVKATQPQLVDQMLVAAQSDTVFDEALACTLYNLLLPLELQTHFSTGVGLLLEVDSTTARYPWELLDHGGFDDSPGPASQAIPGERRSRSLLRKMRVADFRRQPRDAMASDVPLIIGPPALGDEGYAPLPGAQAEAQAVASAFDTADLLLDATPLDVLKAALATPRRIVHMAGHGIYTEGGHSGMVLKGGTLLGPREFESMAVVPELVFVNCCHLGAIRPDRAPDRHLFAANVAEQLIRNGVRCVVAAGWAVSDLPAQEFARAFYDAILQNKTFQDAVLRARKAAHRAEPHGNTWAAYQCYGDPNWRLTAPPAAGALKDTASGEAASVKPPPVVCSGPDLTLLLADLQARAMDARGPQRAALLVQFDQLCQHYESRYADDGVVLEAMGHTLLSLGRKQDALDYLQRALCAEDGRASLRAREVFLNHRARMATDADDIRQVIHDVQMLLSVGVTSERLCLLGSAYKRLAMRPDLSQEQVYEAVSQMHDAYFLAEQLAPDNLHYPLSQRLWAQWHLHCCHPTHTAPTLDDLHQLRASITHYEKLEGADFWSVVAQHEVDVLAAVLHHDMQSAVDKIIEGLELLYIRVRLPRNWESVRDQARFGLLPYQQALPSGPERDAVQALMTSLERFCL